MPDLVLVDGGKGQLAAAIAAMDERGVNVPVVSIAKRDEELLVSKSGSRVDDAKLRTLIAQPIPGVSVVDSSGYYFVNLHVGRINAGGHSRNLRGGDSVSPYDELTKLFQRIRDESHRFAINYHSTLQRKHTTRSLLDDIPGVGPATRKKLLKAFGSVRGVTTADEAAVRAVVGQVVHGVDRGVAREHGEEPQQRHRGGGVGGAFQLGESAGEGGFAAGAEGVEKHGRIIPALADVVKRVEPYFKSDIEPELKAGKTVLIAAHGNSLRAIVKMLDNLSEEEIAKVNIPTAIPLLYELDENFKPVKPRGEYLDPEAAAAGAAAVAAQGQK
jgi:bisphosphoglycerate-dependent phosphoglycerate mutase